MRFDRISKQVVIWLLTIVAKVLYWLKNLAFRNIKLMPWLIGLTIMVTTVITLVLRLIFVMIWLVMLVLTCLVRHLAPYLVGCPLMLGFVGLISILSILILVLNAILLIIKLSLRKIVLIPLVHVLIQLLQVVNAVDNLSMFFKPLYRSCYTSALDKIQRPP